MLTLNHAYCGGVIPAENDDVNMYTITNSNFSNNSALLFGGVIYADGGGDSSMSMAHNIFTGNQAEIHAAVMYVNDRLNVTVSGCKFMKKSGSAGIFYVYRVNALFIRCEFVDNIATVAI